jgi:hypothetical protein
MSILLPCPQCRTRLRVGTEHAGKKVRCRCGHLLRVPPLGLPATAGPARTPARPAPVLARPSSAVPRPAAVRPASARPAPAGLSPGRAEATVRAVAEKHRAAALLRGLGRVKPAAVANARAGFAADLGDETPLLLVDRSFLQNGSAGLLLTNRKLYSSVLGEGIPLEDVVVTTGQTPTQLEQLLVSMGGILSLFFRHRVQSRLLINGEEVDRGPLTFPFWVEVLTRLGRESRGRGGRTRARFRDEDLARLAAAAVAQGKEADATLAELTAAGVEADAAGPLVEEMVAVRDRPRYGVTAAALAFGSLLFLLGLLITLGTMGSDVWFIAYGPVLFGLGLLGTGLHRLVKGPPLLTTADLLKTWGADPHPRRRSAGPPGTPAWVWVLTGTALAAVVLAVAVVCWGLAERQSPAPWRPGPVGEGGSSSTTATEEEWDKVGKAPTPVPAKESPKETLLPGSRGPRLVRLAGPGPGVRIREVYVDTEMPLGRAAPDPLPTRFPSGTRRLNVVVVLDGIPSGNPTFGYRLLSREGPVDARPPANEDGLAATSITIDSPPALVLFAEGPGEAFPDGPFRAVVQIDGRDCYELNWSVGGP